MSTVQTWILGYVANCIWQIPLLFAVAWLLTRRMRRIGPQAEHRVWVAALLAQVLLPACSFQPMELARSMWGLLTAWLPGGGGRGMVTVTTAFGAAQPHSVLRLPEWLLATVAGLFAACLAYFAARLLWGLWNTAALRSHSTPLVMEEDAEFSWQRCCRDWGVRGAVLAESCDISGPVTLGMRRPMLLLPTGWLARVGRSELLAAMAHECAHMARRDFAKNLLYEALSLAAAWHPVLWMTRSRITESREMVCDAMAAEAVDGRQRYARALLRLASMAGGQTPAKTLHAIGIFDANHFERRVMRLTEKREAVRGVRRAVLAAVCVVAGLGTCASAMALHMTVGAPAPRQETASATPRISGGLMAGNILTRVNPVYPQAAKDAKVQGAVRLKAIIGKDGAVRSLQVISGPEELTHSALDAVHQWVYKPYLLNGQPTEVETVITVNYSLMK